MKSLWVWLGKAAFWVSLPLLAVYLSLTKRTRVIVKVGDEILVQKAWLGDGNWILPGGGLHSGEDIATGAARELFEESGVSIDPGTLKLYFTGKLPFRLGLGINTSVYGVTLDAKPSIRLPRFELVELSWENIDTLQNDRYIGQILKQAGLIPL